jgi:hypothetical protein
MGVLRTSILLISIVLEVGKLLAAMVAGGGLLQIDAVSTSIKPYYPPVLPPSSLSGRLGGMALASSRLSEGGGMDSDSFSNTGDLDLRRTDTVEQPSSSSLRRSLLHNWTAGFPSGYTASRLRSRLRATTEGTSGRHPRFWDSFWKKKFGPNRIGRISEKFG